MSKTYNINTGSSGIIDKSLLSVMPCGHKPNSQFYWKSTLMYEIVRTINDADIAAFLCVVKAYTDNKFDALSKGTGQTFHLADVVEHNEEDKDLAVSVFSVYVSEVSRLAYNRRASSKMLLESLERISSLNIHLLDDKLRSRGFIKLINAAVLSDDKKTVRVSINRQVLKSLAANKLQYNFDKMLQLKGLAKRLYLVMQNRKYKAGKGKYRYTNIDDAELRLAMNHNNKDTKKIFERLFKEIGIKFVLGRNGKWFYPEKRLNVFA